MKQDSVTTGRGKQMSTVETATIKGLLKEMLEQHFGDLFVFDPIVVEIRKDHDDIDYVHAYVVFDGDFEKLEPSWTVDLPEKLLPHSMAMGCPGIPEQSFIAKSEWNQLERMLR